MPKKFEDLLGPVGNPDVDYIRGRLRGIVSRSLGITHTRKQAMELARCLDKATTFAEISRLAEEAIREMKQPVWQLEMEPLLVEVHGAWRYEGRPEVLRQDLEKSSHRYLTLHVMDALLKSCGWITNRSRSERMDDAAWFAVKTE